MSQAGTSAVAEVECRPRVRRIALYTAITGGYDTLYPPPDQWAGQATFIAYTDQPGRGAGWAHREVCRNFNDPRRNAKVHKIVPRDLWEDFDASIWIDGSVIIKSPTALEQLVNDSLSQRDLAVFRHRTRECLYDEAVACARANKDSLEVMQAQTARYRTRGYPERNGLHECTVLIRRHNPAVRALCEAWWTEIERGSVRDQLSFDYVLWKTGFSVADLPGTIMNNDHFLWVYHDGSGAAPRPVV